MNDETRTILFDMENDLCERIGTDKIANSKSEMQAYNRGVAEGMKLIKKLLDKDNNELLTEIDLELN